jgi:hypothetical protein
MTSTELADLGMFRTNETGRARRPVPPNSAGRWADDTALFAHHARPSRFSISIAYLYSDQCYLPFFSTPIRRAPRQVLPL